MAVHAIKEVVVRPEQIEEIRRGVKRYDFDAIPLYDSSKTKNPVLPVEGEKDCVNALQRMRAYNREHPEFEVRAITRAKDNDDRLVYVEFARFRREGDVKRRPGRPRKS